VADEPPPPPPPPPADASGTPLLAPGYSAKAEGEVRRQTARGVGTVIAVLAVTAFGVWQAVSGLNDEPETVPVFRPVPYTPPPFGEFDLNACNTAAVGDPDAQLRCVREYNRRITERPNRYP
jgi:hypothetical protein